MKSLFSIMAIPLLLIGLGNNSSLGQEEDPKIVRFRERVESAQQRVDEAEGLIFSADSLVAAGNEMKAEAEFDLKGLAQEKRRIERDFFNAKKPLEKQLKSKDRNEVNLTKEQLKQLENENKALTQDWNEKYKTSSKQLETSLKMIDRGKSNLKKAKTRKKDAERRLKDAEKNLARIIYE